LKRGEDYGNLNPAHVNGHEGELKKHVRHLKFEMPKLKSPGTISDAEMTSPAWQSHSKKFQI